jgi:phosphoglycerate dehydrogenase-like enzyme
MKTIILSPAADILLTQELQEKLQSVGQLTVIKEGSLNEIEELQDNEPKIIAIDPDFCGWKVTKEDLHRMRNVKSICLQTTSFGWIDTRAAKDLGIPVLNLRGFSTEAVAEWSMMMVLAVARRIPIVIKDEWKIDFVNHKGIELKGRTAGIIGLGSIGTRIAELCEGMGMHAAYWSQNARDGRFAYKELPALFKEADVIFLTLAHNAETEKLITDTMLRSMKHSAIFTSVVHKIYNHDLIVQLVGEGKLYGYAFETGTQKMTDFKGNIWAGPELAWCTQSSMERNAEMWVRSIMASAKGDHPTQVNK